MPFVYHTVDGKQVTNWVDDADIMPMIQSGTLVDAKVNLADKHGTIFSAPFDLETLQSAQSEGLRFETPEEYQFEQERREFGEDPLDVAQAGLAAGLRGATFGLSDVLLEELNISSPEDLAAFQRQNPGVDLTGEMLGGAVPALFTGGGSLAATGAKAAVTGAKTLAKTGIKAGIKSAIKMTPAGQAAKAALKAERAISKALGGGRAAQLTGAGVAYGAEGAAYGLGHAISESVIHDRELISEATLADVGLGAILGGGTVAGLQAAGYGLGKMVHTVKKVIPESKPGKPGLMTRIMAKGDPDGAKALDEAFKDPEARKILHEHDAFVEDIVNGMSEAKRADWLMKREKQLVSEGIPADQAKLTARAESTLETASLPELYDDIQKNLRQIQKHHMELKPEHARKLVASGNEEVLYGSAQKVLDDYDDAFIKMRDAGQGEYNQGLVLKGIKRGKAVRKKLDEIIEVGGQHQNADIWYEIDKLKKDMGTYTKKSLAARKQDFTQRAKTDEFKRIYERLRAHLENPAHGDMAVRVQKPVNKAFKSYLDQLEADMKVRLMRKGPAGPEWEPSTWKSDPKGFARLVKQLDTAEGALDTDYFLAQLRTRADLMTAIKEAYQFTGKDLDAYGKAIAATDAMERKIGKALRGANLMHGIQRISSPLTFDAKAALRVGAPAAAGLALGGPVMGLAAGVATAVANPARMIQILHWADKLTGKSLAKMGKSVKQFISKKGVKPKPAVSALSAITGLSLKDKKGIDKNIVSGYRKINTQLQALQDPETLDRRVKTTSLLMPIDMQEMMGTQAKRMVDHLAKHAPEAGKQSYIEMVRGEPSSYQKSQITKWFNRVAVASNPIETIMNAMDSKALTSEMVDTLQELYPKLYQKLVVNIQEEIASSDDPISYQDRIQLSVLLNQPMDATLEPGFVGRMQKLSRQPQQEMPEGEAPQGAAKPMNVRYIGQIDAPQYLQTGTQRLEAKR